jgi:L-amino acid N-acyltransferase YncA
MTFVIRPAESHDAEAIAAIYNYYFLNTIIVGWMWSIGR